MVALTDWIERAVSYPAARALLVMLVAVVAARVVDFMLCRVLRGLVSRTATDLDDRLIDRLHRPIFLTVILVGLRLAFSALEVPEAVLAVVGASVATLIILIWSFAALGVCSELLQSLSRVADAFAWLDVRTLPLFDNLAKILIFGGAVYALLVTWNLDVSAWLASAGIIGIAVSFAAKDSLANLFGGLFVIADAPYKIGDFINLDSGERGEVIKIGLRSTRLLTRDDVEITVPNGVIANAKIVNESGGPWEHTRVAVTVGVAYGSDVDRVRDVLMRAAAGVEHVVQDPEPRVRFTEMGDSALVFRVLCWIEGPVRRGAALDALNTAVYKALVAANISIPFPQRDVHLYSTAPQSEAQRKESPP